MSLPSLLHHSSSSPVSLPRLPPLSELDARLRRFEQRAQSNESPTQLSSEKNELTKQLEELKLMLSNTTRVINEIDKKLNRPY
ncbi:hypothetical protein CONCODRAFT_80111 [Conidiobolus coronatus NRRL 28638]|uniref:Uncharacterized protein n=1 Tax=Conidiobolus coronatus (strain ATCC 28846 / CBS 209.66 / NRRL 28638) TaxID=796925 RepID=A0A137NXU9_CONC2|nr:hypothetical protein CONCODRAFT_80111 [Conidiobolus coronatus NRRL 28638]|eukprot:KXN67522.1 hypothetical protein CONCODRAFT_80111 [Conidiobolus coronatus NRRL 28638]